MRKSLYAVLVGSALFSCAKKQSPDMAAARNEAREPTISGVAAGSGAADMPPPAPMEMEKKADSAAADKPTDRGVMAPKTQAFAGVRAGEWDDNANYRDYVKWLDQNPKSFARLDVRDRQFLVVTDKNGKPVPNCTIAIQSNEVKTSLVTMSSGRALWFPHAYGVTGKAQATATCGQAAVVRATVAAQLDSVTKLVLDSERSVPARRTIDLAFVLDTTGSMSEEIEAVKQTIKAVADTLSTDQTDVRIGLVEYKDRGDSLVTKTYAFSSDLAAFSRSVSNIVAEGGGDLPEDMQQGVSDALDKLQWRGDAVARVAVVIADAPPHLDYQNQRTFAESAKLAAQRGIKLFTVSASGMDDNGQVVMRQMAQFTGASNMFVLRGGAGPQSVGGGDPKSSCGGTQEQYASGKLDKLILNKVRQELSAVDADPMRIAGVGKDESSKPCNERIVMAY